MLFYKKLVADLKEEGFVVNRYDPCVANKMVNGKQLTLTWHVDDVKASHKDKKVIDDFVQWIRDKYEDVTPVKPSQGKKHDYLAMMLDYEKVPGAVVIDMSNYVKSIVKDFKFQEELGKEKPKTPAAGHLFEVRDDAEKLDKERAEEFHTTVAKALFVVKRSQSDIQTTVAFLCTR